MTKPFFTVAITVRNAEPWIAKCIMSLRAQTFTDWEAVIVDDASEDGTHARALEAIAGDERFTVICNTERRLKLANILKIAGLARGSVYVELDGDDWLCNDAALAIVYEIYQSSPLVDATHGSYEYADTKHDVLSIPYPIERGRRFPVSGWCAGPLRTIKMSLIQYNIEHDKDIWIDPESEGLFHAADDIAIYGGAIIRAREIKLVPNILYTINDDNPNRVHYLNPNGEVRAGDIMLRRFSAREIDEADKAYEWSL